MSGEKLQPTAEQIRKHSAAKMRLLLRRLLCGAIVVTAGVGAAAKITASEKITTSAAHALQSAYTDLTDRHPSLKAFLEGSFETTVDAVYDDRAEYAVFNHEVNALPPSLYQVTGLTLEQARRKVADNNPFLNAVPYPGTSALDNRNTVERNYSFGQGVAVGTVSRLEDGGFFVYLPSGEIEIYISPAGVNEATGEVEYAIYGVNVVGFLPQELQTLLANELFAHFASIWKAYAQLHGSPPTMIQETFSTTQIDGNLAAIGPVHILPLYRTLQQLALETGVPLDELFYSALQQGDNGEWYFSESRYLASVEQAIEAAGNPQLPLSPELLARLIADGKLFQQFGTTTFLDANHTPHVAREEVWKNGAIKWTLDHIPGNP